MGLFDLFGREPKTKTSRRQAVNEYEGIIKTNGSKGPVAVFSPTAYNDVQTIIDCLKTGKTAIVHLTELKTETATRILDMLSGAVYALNGGV